MAEGRKRRKDWERDESSDEESSQARKWTGDLNRIYKDYVAMWRKDPAAKFPGLVKSFIMGDLVDKIRHKFPVFAENFLGVFPTGSFYGGTRVARPTEFDLDFVMYFREIQWKELVPGYLRPQHQTIRNPTRFGYQPLGFQTSFGWVALTPEDIRDWFYRVCSAALKSLSNSSMARWGIANIEWEQNGPAFTLNVTKTNEEAADIDLVPTFVVINPSSNKLQAFAIPKRHPHRPDLWRYSKTWEERRLLLKSGCAKKILKLLKKFRDAQGPSWKEMASYYLKTVVLHQLANTGNLPWDERDKGEIFVQLLKRLHGYLENGKIPFYWNRGCNLLEFVAISTLDKMRRTLGKIITKIESGEEEVSEYLMGYDEKIVEAIIQYREIEERKATRKQMAKRKQIVKRRRWDNAR